MNGYPLHGIMDMHVHSALSFDSDADMLLQCAWAKKIGLMGLCFTEHIDHGAEVAGFSIEPDRDEYRRRIEKARAQYPTLSIGMGMEVGYTPAHFKLNDVIAREGWDSVVWSVHEANGVDPYLAAKYFGDRPREATYRDYLLAILNSVRAESSYQTIGHIGYASRYAPYSDRAMRLSDGPDILDEIFKTIINKGIALEVNTSEMRPEGIGPMPNFPLLKRYKQLGGEMVTLGSDAHCEQNIGQYFPRAIDLLREIGIPYVISFMDKRIVAKTRI